MLSVVIRRAYAMVHHSAIENPCLDLISGIQVPDGAPHELVHWYTTGCIHGDVVISLLFPMIHVFMHLSDSTWHSTPPDST